MSAGAQILKRADGPNLGYWKSGEGPPLLLIHGITSTHETYEEFVPHLSGDRTVYTYDRRGRGESEDGEGGYAVEQEFKDAADLITHLSNGGKIDVFGHSFGAYIALGATKRAEECVGKVVVYSPGFGNRYPDGVLESIEAQWSEGHADEALRLLMTKIIGMPDDEVDFMQQSPAWAARVAAFGTVPRECRADRDFDLAAAGLGQLSEPVLIISGGANAENKRAVAASLLELLPDAEMVQMDGEGHAAHHTAPESLARLTLRFLA